jgi:hypothetical protein
MKHHSPNGIAATTTYANYLDAGYRPATITRFHYHLFHPSESPSSYFVLFSSGVILAKDLCEFDLSSTLLPPLPGSSFDLRFST